MPQLVGLRNTAPGRRKGDKKKLSQHCYFQSYETLHHARVAIQKLQEEIDALKAASSEPATSEAQTTTPENEAEPQDIPPQTMLKIIGLELSQGEIRLKLKQTQRHLSTMRVLPIELFESILVYAHYYCLIPRLTLALVCRTWHLVVRHTPRLWSDISLVTPYKCHISKPVEWLKKRIVLAKGAALDVTLSATCSPFAGTKIHINSVWKTTVKMEVVKRLHKLVFATGTERWRSLTILDGQRIADDTNTNAVAQTVTQNGTGVDSDLQAWITTKLRGARFPRLTVLDMRHYVHVPFLDVYTGLYAALEWTATNLEACFLDEIQIPAGFLIRPEKLFRSLSELKTGDTMIRRLELPETLRSLSVPNAELASVDFSRITDLTLLTFNSAGTIHFPALTNLSIASPSLATFQQLTAPNLQSLAIGTGNASYERGNYHPVSYGSENPTKAIIAHFRDSSDPSSIYPTTLHLRDDISIEAIGCILERWHQLLRVSLNFWRDQYGVEGPLRELEGILKARDNVNGETGTNALATWKACPALETLHFESEISSSDRPESSDEEENYGYEHMARAVQFSRRHGPLWRITWGVSGQGGG